MASSFLYFYEVTRVCGDTEKKASIELTSGPVGQALKYEMLHVEV